MPTINNIPQEMIVEHVNWHTLPGNPGAGGRAVNPWPPGATAPAPGSGEEFLVWHHGYVTRFHEWVDGLPNAQRPAAAAIEPWNSIPIGLKMGMLGWNSQLASDEAQLQDMSNFSTLDDLGRFLEWGLHGWLHNASSGMWNEPVLRSFESPRSTYFWQLHGLIDHWRQQWVDAHPHPRPPLAIDPDQIREILRMLRSFRNWPVPRPIPPPGPRPDPAPFDLTSDEARLIGMLRQWRDM